MLPLLYISSTFSLCRAAARVRTGPSASWMRCSRYRRVSRFLESFHKRLPQIRYIGPITHESWRPGCCSFPRWGKNWPFRKTAGWLMTLCRIAFSTLSQVESSLGAYDSSQTRQKEFGFDFYLNKSWFRSPDFICPPGGLPAIYHLYKIAKTYSSGLPRQLTTYLHSLRSSRWLMRHGNAAKKPPTMKN